jgi:hypothetical protein
LRNELLATFSYLRLVMTADQEFVVASAYLDELHFEPDRESRVDKTWTKLTPLQSQFPYQLVDELV